jgi:ATP-dependent DNA helicase RecG
MTVPPVPPLRDACDGRDVRAGLRSLPGVGPAREAKLARLGVESVRDLLLLLPRRLDQWEAPISIEAALALAPDSPPVTLSGRAVRHSLLHTGRRRSVLRVRVADDTDEIDVLFFNQPWLRERFDRGSPVEVHGQITSARGTVLVAARLSTEAQPLPPPGTLTPIYPTTEGVAQGLLSSLCGLACEGWADAVVEPLDEAALARAGLPALPAAVRALHAPPSRVAFDAARRRVALEPILALQTRLWERRSRRAEGDATVVEVDTDLHAELLARLPHTPTDAQRRAIDDLRRDLGRSVPMRRLLQGDVGSGKTLVGLYACLATASRGAQSAFLAPTELLVEQHHTGLLPGLRAAGVTCELLTGSLPAAERRAVGARIERGEVDVVFGTHALFSEGVRFARLALAVIDEQHRFGVVQRQRLLDKGEDVHGLLMTATPIPRSLAMTLYGDLDPSVLDERPPGRGEVSTRWMRGPEQRQIPARLDERLAAGERAYWVIPRIEGEESGAIGAEGRFARLSEHALARYGVELVHGRLPAEERARRLERFRRGEVQLLVATTVIEVGVDVPEATVMVIECAERLGLAQLHQLRGRIGRGARPSYCYLMGQKSAAERFATLERTHDGFEIAEEDLRRRGMGDLVGRRQAGDSSEGLDDPAVDVDLLLFARELVSRHAHLRAAYAGERVPDL